ncbi:MAG: phosphate acetyltransferase, partial [Oscillospiraceae bacterium]|nr:phosphate acetyltransferase [Oscillospiraceae bacterium]
MDIMEKIYERAKAAPQRVAFPEATEEKILLAARECEDKGYCIPVLVGVPEEIENAAKEYGVSLEGIAVVDAFNEEWLEKLINNYVEKNPLNSIKTMKRKSKDPMYTALMMQATGMVDVTFAGL